MHKSIIFKNTYKENEIKNKRVIIFQSIANTRTTITDEHKTLLMRVLFSARGRGGLVSQIQMKHALVIDVFQVN